VGGGSTWLGTPDQVGDSGSSFSQWELIQVRAYERIRLLGNTATANLA